LTLQEKQDPLFEDIALKISHSNKDMFFI